MDFVVELCGESLPKALQKCEISCAFDELSDWRLHEVVNSEES